MGSAWDSTPGGAAPAPAASAGAAAPAAAPLSAWDATPSGQPQPARGVMDGLGDLGSAFVHHVTAPLHGAAQFIENSVAAGAAKLPDNPISRYIVDTAQHDNQAQADWERNYQASTPNGWGASAGATLGTVAPFVVGAVPRSLSALGEAVASRAFPAARGAAPSLLARATSGAVQGAAVGAAQPVVTPQAMSYDDYLKAFDAAPDDATKVALGNQYAASVQGQRAGYWSQAGSNIAGGAAAGGTLPLLAGAANGAWQAGKSAVINSPLLNPTGYAGSNIAAALGPDAATIAGKLASAPQYVPGSIPTSAQAGGNPTLVMIEKSLANNSKPFQQRLQSRQIDNNAARWDVINSVAKTPDDLQAAIDSRDAATAPMRDFTVTNGNPVPVGGVLDSINGVRNGPLGMRPTIGGATNDMASKVQGVSTTAPGSTLMNVPSSTTASPGMLDALRQNANDYLSKYAPNGAVGTQEQAAMAPIKSAIIDAIDAANPRRAPSAGGWGQGMEQAGPTAPGYRDYLAEFAKRSVPVNTMQLGQTLADQLGVKSADASGTPLLTLGNYTGRLAAALRGSPYAIDPDAQAALEGVQSDLQRATISNSVRTAGSDTAYNQGAGTDFLRSLGAVPQSNAKAAAAAGATLATTGSKEAAAGVYYGLGKFGDFKTGRVQSAMSDLLLDPQGLAAALQKASQPPSTTVPALLTGFGGKLTPAMAAAVAIELQKQQTPAVVGNAPQNAYQQ